MRTSDSWSNVENLLHTSIAFRSPFGMRSDVCELDFFEFDFVDFEFLGAGDFLFVGIGAGVVFSGFVFSGFDVDRRGKVIVPMFEDVLLRRVI